MKVRIGNDISLDVLLQYRSDGSNTNINSVKAYIINASKEGEFEEYIKNKTNFISRFPVEPYVDAYSSTAYDIKSCGYPTWRAYPRNYVYATYSGFGPNPDWKHIYRRMPEKNLTQYQAEVKYTADRSRVRVFFPAEAQLYTGTYNLVIVAKVYEFGYHTDNLRTVTTDYENVFTLVSRSSEGVDNPVTIDVNTTTRSDKADSVRIYGNSIIGINNIGLVMAKVEPLDVEDPTVTWHLSEEDELYITILERSGNMCKFSSPGLPQGIDQVLVTMYAISNLTPDVHGEYTITVNRDYHIDTEDVYVYDGAFDDSTDVNNLSLFLTSGELVDIDLSKATGWYEGT